MRKRTFVKGRRTVISSRRTDRKPGYAIRKIFRNAKPAGRYRRK